MNNFDYEISKIQNEHIKNIVVKTLEVVPEYFWRIAASSTSKYHPQYALGEGGLVRHTKAAVAIALCLFENSTVQNFTQEEKDLIIASLILHDTAKKGVVESKYSVAEHPLLVKKLFQKVEWNEEEQHFVEIINNLIETHMGEWCTKYNSKVEILPKPKSKLQRFTHLCDYLSSRRFLEVNFDAI
ncbi:MAG TPA: HD domain-containing protein [Gallicola sp.]|nr:HD domain-containing protein [Gallicola sp.]